MLRGCVLLALAGCVDMSDGGESIVGTSGDVMTAPGAYAGYRVVAPCEMRHVNLGVIGTGAVELSDTTDIHLVGDELGTLLRDVPSVWGYGGHALACESRVGTTIHTNSWQDVDTIIGRVGDYLRDRDYALQVGISVGTIPVAH